MEILYFIIGAMSVASIYSLIQDYKIRKELKELMNELDEFLKSIKN